MLVCAQVNGGNLSRQMFTTELPQVKAGSTSSCTLVWVFFSDWKFLRLIDKKVCIMHTNSYAAPHSNQIIEARLPYLYS